MKASIATGVKCNYCHAGNKRFTNKSEIAEKMFELSEMMDVECRLLPQWKRTLTPEGSTKDCYVTTKMEERKATKDALPC